jgi:hypothetical protein
MSQNALQDFFHKKLEKASSASVDWARKRDMWIAAVKRLFKTIQGDYLREAPGEVIIDLRDKVISERLVGEYRIPELILQVRDEQVVFSPKGINVAGVSGRIDVVGDRGDAMLVWQGDDHWSIVVSRVPSIRLVSLDSESLAAILAGIMRP